jgi:hypothetical protein
MGSSSLRPEVQRHLIGVVKVAERWERRPFASVVLRPRAVAIQSHFPTLDADAKLVFVRIKEFDALARAPSEDGRQCQACSIDASLRGSR